MTFLHVCDETWETHLPSTFPFCKRPQFLVPLPKSVHQRSPYEQFHSPSQGPTESLIDIIYRPSRPCLFVDLVHSLRPQGPIGISFTKPDHFEAFFIWLINFVKDRHQQLHLDNSRPAAACHVDVFLEQCTRLESTGLVRVSPRVQEGGSRDEIVPLGPCRRI